MLGRILSSAIGAKIDRQEGDRGVKGAILGWLAPTAVKGAVRLGALAAVGLGVAALVKKSRR